jgi:hypothetical protein
VVAALNWAPMSLLIDTALRRPNISIGLSQVALVVSTRSMMFSMRHSSAMMPPSPLMRWLRLKPMAMI